MKKVLAVILVFLFLFASVGALADYGAILKKNARVYADSGLRTPVGTLPRYLAVKVKSVKSGKAKISVRGSTVYVRSRYLQRPWIDFLKERRKQGIDHLEDCIRYVRKTCYVYDYPNTKAKKLKRVKKGTELTGFMEKNGWSIVMDPSEKFYGYILTSKLEGVSGGDGTHYRLQQ